MSKSNFIAKAVTKLDDQLKIGHDVVEVTPNTTTTTTQKQIYQLGGGSRGQLASQVSSFMANYEYSQSLFGLDPPDFEKWCEEFENCFPSLIGKNVLFGNRLKPWGKAQENRPRIKILNGRDKDRSRYIWAEFYPNRDNKEEVYFVSGTPFMCVNQIMNIWNQREVLDKADLAQVLGFPPSEWVVKRPTLGLSVQFVLWNYKSPVHWKADPKRKKVPKRVQISIPFAKRSALTYEAIRNALGGDKGLVWGSHTCRGNIADSIDNFPKNRKGMPEVSCKGKTYAEAKSTLKKLLQFIDGKIVWMGGSETDTSEDLNSINSNATATIVYPIFMYVLNSRMLDFSSPQGRETRLGKLDTKKNKFELWHSTKPVNFDKNLDELFKWN